MNLNNTKRIAISAALLPFAATLTYLLWPVRTLERIEVELLGPYEYVDDADWGPEEFCQEEKEECTYESDYDTERSDPIEEAIDDARRVVDSINGE
jgi:hypothetical protein